jgi:hypothetical protein
MIRILFLIYRDIHHVVHSTWSLTVCWPGQCSECDTTSAELKQNERNFKRHAKFNNYLTFYLNSFCLKPMEHQFVATEVVDDDSQLPKLGIRNLSPHLRNSVILRTTILIAELRTKKSCGTAIADLQNLTSAIPQLSPVSCQSATF